MSANNEDTISSDKGKLVEAEAEHDSTPTLPNEQEQGASAPKHDSSSNNNMSESETQTQPARTAAISDQEKQAAATAAAEKEDREKEIKEIKKRLEEKFAVWEIRGEIGLRSRFGKKEFTARDLVHYQALLGRLKTGAKVTKRKLEEVVKEWERKEKELAGEKRSLDKAEKERRQSQMEAMRRLEGGLDVIG